VSAELLILAFFAFVGVILLKILAGGEEEYSPYIAPMPPPSFPYYTVPRPKKVKKKVIIMPEKVVREYRYRKRRRKIV